MRYGIFSDIHSNLEALEAVISAYKKESIDQYLCVGDIVGYAANPNECVMKTKEIIDGSVAGNHDRASVDLLSGAYFNPLAREAISWTKQNLNPESIKFLEPLKLIYKNKGLTLVHGTLNNPESFEYMSDVYIARESFSLLETLVCFVGHTHTPGIFTEDAAGGINYSRAALVSLKQDHKYIVNTGSVGQPRDGDPRACYSIYDTDKKEVQIKRVAYNVDTAREKIIAAALPQYLGDRLITGS